MDVLDSFLKLLCQRNAIFGNHGVVLSEPGAFGGFFTQYHVRVIQEVAVDGIAVLVLTGLHPVRLDGNGPVAFLQEDNVGYNFGAGIGFEGIVGQSDGTQELRPFCQILPNIAVLGIHGIAAGDKGHDTTGTQLIHGFGEEVVMNGKTQPVIGWVIDLILPEGNVAHGKVKEVTAVCFLKTADGDIGFGIQLLGDPASDGIQFHAVQTAVLHLLRQHTEEVADTHRRFQNVAGLETHLRDGIVHGFDNRWRGIVGIEGGTSGGTVLLGSQCCSKFLILFRPACLGFIKGVCKTAPAHIPRKNSLLFRGGLPILCFQSLQQMDGIHVHPELSFGTTNTQSIIRDPEILCLHHRGRRFRFSGADGLEYHIVGKSTFFTRDVFLCFDGVSQFHRGWFFGRNLCRGFLFFDQSSDKGNGFRPEDGKAGGILEGNVLEVNRSELQIHTVNQKSSAINLKGGFTGDQMLTGKFLVGEGWFCCLWNGDGDSLIDAGNVLFVHVPLK